MEQNQHALTPTALLWDCDGELCPEDLDNLMDRLRLQTEAKESLYSLRWAVGPSSRVTGP